MRAHRVVPAIRMSRPRYLVSSLDVVALTALACLAGSACVRAQDAGDALRQTAARYQALESYHFEANVLVSMAMEAAEQDLDMYVLMAEHGPDYLRAEVKGPTMAVVVVTNEAGTYMYMPTLNQYVHSTNSAPMEVGQMTEDLLGEYRRVADDVADAVVAGREAVELDGTSFETIILDVTYLPEDTETGADSTFKRLWIDPERMLVLRDSTSAYVSRTPFGGPMTVIETTHFTRVDVDAAPPLALFEFTPPEDAELVTPSEMLDHTEEQADAVRAASDFSLVDLEGKDVRLSELRGSVVLVNFWATWCGPCRSEMPALERIYQDERDRGFTVLAVNLGESSSEVRRYVDDGGFTFPILLDEASYVGTLYQAYSIPMSYIIDREGRVSRVLVGAHPETAIREALEAAGL